MNRYTATVALIGLALLAGAAGCGSGEELPAGGKTAATSGPNRNSSGAPGTSSGPAGALAPTAGQLASYVLAPGAEAGRYEASEGMLDEPSSEAYEAMPKVCTPLTTLSGAGHTAHAYVTVGVPGEFQEVDTDILMRSYSGDGAAAAMKSLSEAGRRCAVGYTEDRALVEANVTEVKPVAAPSLGDEALAFRIVVQDVKDRNISLYKYLTVIRSGSVTLSFRSDILDVKDFGGVPPEVMTAQWEKFTKASGAGS
ncbi:hypothetical protein ACFWVT_08100 [Streptomyces cyaneofuscatus]|uniref:hypothetical protein n=1 Tax=Streptomyces cyaneofuscatus TaxID=66883 RepID=UPI00364FF40C